MTVYDLYVLVEQAQHQYERANATTGKQSQAHCRRMCAIEDEISALGFDGPMATLTGQLTSINVGEAA